MNVTINGSPVDGREGETIIDTATRNRIRIPELCRFEGYDNGVCRICMVEVDEPARLVPSCSTRIREGMRIVTESTRINDYRKSLLTHILKNHGPHTDGKEAKCALHGYAREFSVPAQPEVRLVSSVDRSHPAIDFDPGLCIGCRKCLIACDQEQNNDIIEITGRGSASVITFAGGSDLGSSRCVSCGACVDVCPTGSLIERDWQAAERTVVTTCPYCAVGCTVEYGITAEKIVWARGARENLVNKGKLCVKGKFGYDYETSKDRLLYPLIRKAGVSRGPLNGMSIESVFRRATWDEALELVSRKISGIRDEYGPAAIGGIACDRSTNEDIYAFQKFMRAVLKSDSVDQSATLCHSPSAGMLSWGLGAGSSTNPLQDIFNSRTIIVVGSNTDSAHPVVSAYLKKAAKNGVHLVVIDPRRVELAERAGTFLQIKPGADTFLFSAMAKYIVENDLYDHEYVENHSETFDEFVESLKSFSLDRVEEVTGIPRTEVERVATMYAIDKPSSIYWGLGITEHHNGSDNVSSMVNLAILTGNIGVPGGGLNPIRGQNNVQGGADMGASPGSLPGYQSLVDPETRRKFEDLWKTSLPEEVGWKSTEMVGMALIGELKMMYISGENSVRSHPNSLEVARALQSLDFLVVQDIFMTETAEFADVVFPAATTFEKTGTFTNTERRIQMVRPLFDPPGEAMADWKIYSELSRRLGYDLGFNDASEIMDEIARLVPKWKGVKHSRLQSGGLQWPVPSEDSEGTTILHVGGAMRGKARFRPVEWHVSDETGFPYVLITGRKREQYHTGTMTSRSPVISRITEGPYLEMNVHDMQRENLKEGDTVELESTSGKITCRVKSGGDLPPGVTFTTFHFASMPVNILTPATLDPIMKTPAYKDTRVRISPLRSP